ncbi:MAG: DUF3667 domain-containing protein [Saprospiraceae bacterium]|nr:DUF3667 domain-containing protein [Saprospiraceae bacterium]
MSNCLNCQKALDDAKFCPNCGQTVNTSRITRKTMWQEFLRVYLNFDKGMFFTLRQAFLQPGASAKEYVAGKRIQYMKPLTFIAIASAAAEGATRKLPKDFTPLYHVQGIPEALISLTIIGTFISQWFIKDERYNFWERVILQLFVVFAGLVVVTGIAFFLPRSLSKWAFLAFPPIFACFQAYAFWQFFDLKTPKSMLMATLAAGLLTILGIEALD